jgi:chemotaxis-related protein WspD
VFAAAGRRFLDAPSPAGYLEEWTQRLTVPIEEAATDLQSVLIFRLGEEWMALRVGVLLEVTNWRPIRRIPHRAALLAGLVNIRGELYLCVRLDQLLGAEARSGDRASAPSISRNEDNPRNSNGSAVVAPPASAARLVVVRRDGDRWAFPVDEVDQVYRFSTSTLTGAPATLARAARRLTQGVFVWRERSIGYLDDGRIFDVLRATIR